MQFSSAVVWVISPSPQESSWMGLKRIGGLETAGSGDVPAATCGTPATNLQVIYKQGRN
jgi:hypothetical protein